MQREQFEVNLYRSLITFISCADASKSAPNLAAVQYNIRRAICERAVTETGVVRVKRQRAL